MPFALLIVGVLLLVASVRGTQGDLFKLAKGDFTGQNNFIYWMVSILVIGGLGYIPSLQKLSRVFMALVVVVLFLSRKGFFSQFQQQISQGVGSGTTPSNNQTADYGYPGSLSTDLGLPPLKPIGSNPGDPNNIGWPAGIEIPLAPARPQ